MTAQLPFIKFRERETTKGIMLSYLKADMPLKEYAPLQMKKGWFSVGYNSCFTLMELWRKVFITLSSVTLLLRVLLTMYVSW